MPNVPHELAEEFPLQVAMNRDLKSSNAHFAKLADKCHEVNREIHRIEAGVEPAFDVRSEDLRKHRFQVKEKINTTLTGN